MDFSILKDVLTLFLSITTAYIVIRERVLKLEMRNEAFSKEIQNLKENHQKQISTLEESHEDLENRIYKRFDSIEKMLQDVLLKLERNNVR